VWLVVYLVEMEKFLESTRSRFRVPLEIFCSLSLALYFIFTQLITRPYLPLELFGHVYVNQSNELSTLYVFLACICVWVLFLEICEVFRRCQLLRYGDFAVIMHCTFKISLPTGTTAILMYKQGFAWVSCVVPVGLVSYLAGMFLGSALSIYIAISVTYALNIAVSVANPVLLRESRPNWYKICQVLTVLVTDREYGNLKLEEKKWYPVEIKDFTDSHSRMLSNQTACAVFAADDDENLTVFGSGNIGRKGKRMVHVDKDVDFRIVKMRMPYSLVWYSVYSVICGWG